MKKALWLTVFACGFSPLAPWAFNPLAARRRRSSIAIRTSMFPRSPNAGSLADECRGFSGARGGRPRRGSDSAFYDSRVGRLELPDSPAAPHPRPRRWELPLGGRTGSPRKGEAALPRGGLERAARLPGRATRTVLRLDPSEIAEVPRIASYRRRGAHLRLRAARRRRHSGPRQLDRRAPSTAGTWFSSGSRSGATSTCRGRRRSRLRPLKRPCGRTWRPSGPGAREVSSPRARPHVRAGAASDYRLAWVVTRRIAGRPGHVGRPRGRRQRRAPRLRGQEPVRGPQGHRRRLPRQQRPAPARRHRAGRLADALRGRHRAAASAVHQRRRQRSAASPGADLDRPRRPAT